MRHSIHGCGQRATRPAMLFDRDVAQYGRTSRCIFYFGGSKHVSQPFLPPLPDTTPPTVAPSSGDKPVQLLRIVSARQFLKGVETNAPVWAIQVQSKTSDQSNTHYPSFLQDFAGVFPAEAPDSLSPSRAIQHVIDFVPGATLPNLPHYQLSPSQSAEL